MYVCGVTAYDRCHLGHARSAVIFDVIRRYLSWKGFSVRYVRNFTDVDDKILARAREKGMLWQDLADTYIKEYNSDVKRLGILPADVEPRATEHIVQIIDLVRRLVEKGYAYEREGNVFYRVRRFSRYGQLSKQKLEEMVAGARVEVDDRKEDPLDFALWKNSTGDEPAWESPWGPGRPGWHIECSAMSLSHLGETLDIHGGGQDLVFPHHENEIAQCEAITEKEFVRYWVHNGFVTVNREKMSKSLGNFFAIAEIFEKLGSSPYGYPDEVICDIVRYFLLSTHYRSPIDFSDDALKVAHEGLNNFYLMFQKIEELIRKGNERGSDREEEKRLFTVLKEFPERFESAMDDDFNTSQAIGEFQKLRTSVNSLMCGMSARGAGEAKAVFDKYGTILGLFRCPVDRWRYRYPNASEIIGSSTVQRGEGDEEIVERLKTEREIARKNREWAKADRIREELEKMGIILEDLSDGTTRVRR